MGTDIRRKYIWIYTDIPESSTNQGFSIISCLKAEAPPEVGGDSKKVYCKHSDDTDLVLFPYNHVGGEPSIRGKQQDREND